MNKIIIIRNHFESVYSKTIETINILIKSPKESHFKQEITKYTLFEFNALTTQNKPQTYLIPLKITTIRNFFINNMTPAIAKMSISFIQLMSFNTFKVGFEIT